MLALGSTFVLAIALARMSAVEAKHFLYLAVVEVLRELLLEIFPQLELRFFELAVVLHSLFSFLHSAFSALTSCALMFAAKMATNAMTNNFFIFFSSYK